MNSLFVIVLISFLLIGLIAFFWIQGIDYMQKNHPDYKGDDFLNWDKDESKDNHI